MATDWSGFAHLADPSRPKPQPKAKGGKKALGPIKVQEGPKQSANALTQAIIDYMGLKKWKAWRNQSVGIWDPTKQVFRKNKNALLGVPDVLGHCRKTCRFAAVEVKVGKDKLSTEQAEFLKEVLQAGGFACEARSLDQFISEFEAYLTLKLNQ